MKRRLIILVGPKKSGKTTLARHLTDNGQSGIIIEDCSFWESGVRISGCPLVVFCGECEREIRASKIFQDVAAFDPGNAEVFVWRLEALKPSPLVPISALAEPRRLRAWLLNQGNCHTLGQFTGGMKELAALHKKLPRHPTLDDLLPHLTRSA